MSDATPAETTASIDEMAALTFEPWRHHSEEWKPPSNQQWVALANPHLLSVRLAWLTLHKSKDELTAMSEELGDESFMALVGQIGQSADWFEGLHKVWKAPSVGSCARMRRERYKLMSEREYSLEGCVEGQAH